MKRATNVLALHANSQHRYNRNQQTENYELTSKILLGIDKFYNLSEQYKYVGKCYNCTITTCHTTPTVRIHIIRKR